MKMAKERKTDRRYFNDNPLSQLLINQQGNETLLPISTDKFPRYQSPEKNDYITKFRLENRPQKQNKQLGIKQLLYKIIMVTIVVMACQIIIVMMYSISHKKSVPVFSRAFKSNNNNQFIQQNNNIHEKEQIQQNQIEQKLDDEIFDSSDQKEVLINFKNVIQNPSASESWSGENPCDGWKGIFCENGKISEINLQQQQIYAQIPPEFSKLKYLKKIDISSSGISGTMPLEFSALENLQEIHLQLNALEGKLPPQFSTWKNLNIFTIQYNKFTGNFPEEFSTWENLQSIDIFWNKFRGILPSSFSEWKKISSVQLCHNLLIGEIPIEFSEWKNIQEVFFQHQIEDQFCIPEELQSYFLNKLSQNNTDVKDMITCRPGEITYQGVYQYQY